jgi:DNA-binding NarL/FixJ family response regulator
MTRKSSREGWADRADLAGGSVARPAHRQSPAGETEKKRILIVDDHPVMRHGEAELVNREADLTVCGEVGNAAQALGAIPKLNPDLLLLDLNLPDKNGLELLKDLQALFPKLPVLAVSMQEESFYALRVLRAGGRGYLMKQEGPEQLIAAIRAVLGGEIYVSRQMSGRILQSVSGAGQGLAGAPADRLSDRELEVMRLFGEGWSTEEIAQKLHLSPKTVDVHRANIKEKLGLKTTPEFLRFSIGWARAHSPGMR